MSMRKDLVTDRLILRDITEEDAESLRELDTDPLVMKYIGLPQSTDLASYRERTRTVYLPMQSHPWHGVRVVLDQETAAFLGWVFMRPAPASRHATDFGWTRADEVEVGYRLRRTAWGRGIATEAAAAFVQIALADPSTTAVVACANKQNLGSLRVLHKLGLAPVGEVMLPDEGVTLIELVLQNGGAAETRDRQPSTG